MKIRRRLLGRLVEAFIAGVRTAGIARLDAMEIGLPARLLAGLEAFSPNSPYRGEQVGRVLHRRRKIGSDFHACANFNNDRNIPSHRSNSLSFSPCGPFGSHGLKPSIGRRLRHVLWTADQLLRPRPCGVTQKCARGTQVPELRSHTETSIPQTAQLLSHDLRDGAS